MHRLNNTEGKAKQTTQKELSSSITDIACYRTKVRRGLVLIPSFFIHHHVL